MTRVKRWVRGSGILVLALVPQAARAQSAAVRGSVVDEQGRPLPDVKIEMEFKGESRQKVVKNSVTDKKGGFVRVGLAAGAWTLTFSKEGYQRHSVETLLSLGGVSELPPVALKPAAATAEPGAPASGAGAPAGPSAQDAETAKQLGETYKKAVDALKAGQDAEAEALFKNVLAAAPQVAEAHYNLGYLASKRGDAGAAEAEFRKAIELQPKSSEAYVALAALLAQKARSEEALKLLQDAAADFSQNGRFQFALGAAAFNLGRAEDAQAALTRAGELDPGNAETDFYLGSLALNRNDVPEAVARFEKFVTAAAATSPNLATAKGLLQALNKKPR